MTKLSRLAGFALVAAFFLAGTVTGCLGTDIKDKTSTGKLKFSATDTANASTFKFNFAFDDSTNKIAYLQGSANTKTTMISTCGATGSNCVCEFINAAGTKLTPTTTPVITYDSLGNYFGCDYTVDGATPAGTTSIRLRNQNSTKYSAIYTLDTSATLTITKLLGDLSAGKVRGVYRYTCRHDFLNKIGTSQSTGYFDCSNTAQVGSVAGKNLCLIRGNYPYFIYADAINSNANKRPVDRLYNLELGGQICSLQILQYDCTVNTDGAGGTSTNGNTGPTKQFGIYAEQVGVFDTAVNFVSSPFQTSEFYGYAAQANGTKCPPGLVLNTLYEVTPAAAAFSDSNYPAAGMKATDVTDLSVTPGVAPSNLSMTRLSGGICSGSSCSFTGVVDAVVSGGIPGTFAYAASATKYCVIPRSLTP